MAEEEYRLGGGNFFQISTIFISLVISYIWGSYTWENHSSVNLRAEGLGIRICMLNRRFWFIYSTVNGLNRRELHYLVIPVLLSEGFFLYFICPAVYQMIICLFVAGSC